MPKPWEKDWSKSATKSATTSEATQKPWEKDWSDTIQPLEEGPGMLESGGYGIAKGATLNLVDELAGGLGAIGQGIGAATGGADLDTILQTAKKGYQEHRDIYRETEKEAQAANPKTFLAGEVAGGMALPAGGAIKGAAAVKGLSGLARYKALLNVGKAAAPMAAGQGAIASLGASEVPVEEMGREEALRAALSGATAGATALAAPAVFGGIADLAKGGYGLGKGLLKSGTEAARSSGKLKPLEVGIKTGLSETQVFNPASVSKAMVEGTEAVKAPIQAGREKLMGEIALPAREALEETSEGVSQQLKGQRDFQVRVLQNELADIGENLMHDISKVKDKLGADVGKYEDAILNAPNQLQKTKAIHDFVGYIKQQIKSKGSSLENDPDALRILESYESGIRKAPAKAQELITRITKPGKEPVTKTTIKGKGALSPTELEKLVDESQDVRRIGAELSRTGDTETSKVINEAVLPETLVESVDNAQLLNALKSTRERASEYAGKPLGRVLSAGRGELIKGREAAIGEVLGPEAVEASRQTYKSYGAAKKLLDILPEGSEAQKLISELQDNLKVADPTGANILRNRKIIKSLEAIDPELASAARQSMQDIGERINLTPEVPTAEGVEQLLREAPKSGIPLRKVSAAAKQLGIPEEGFQTTLTKGKEQAAKLIQAEKDIATVNIDDMLASIQSIDDPTAILANDKIRTIISTLKRNGLEAEAAALEKDPSNFIRHMEDVKYMRAPTSGIMGWIASAGKIGGYGLGKTLRTASKPVKAATDIFHKHVAPKLQQFEPEQLEQLATTAEQSGKVLAAKTLRAMTSKDRIAKSAALYMISQQKGLKDDITNLVSPEDETPEGQ
jgi:hypothetical protein